MSKNNSTFVCDPGNLSRNCTENGWSDVQPVVAVACLSNSTDGPSEVSRTSDVQILRSLSENRSWKRLEEILKTTTTLSFCVINQNECHVPHSWGGSCSLQTSYSHCGRDAREDRQQTDRKPSSNTFIADLTLLCLFVKREKKRFVPVHHSVSVLQSYLKDFQTAESSNELSTGFCTVETLY